PARGVRSFPTRRSSDLLLEPLRGGVHGRGPLAHGVVLALQVGGQRLHLGGRFGLLRTPLLLGPGEPLVQLGQVQALVSERRGVRSEEHTSELQSLAYLV